MRLRIFAVIAAIATITFATPAKADTTIASVQLEPHQTQETLNCSATKTQPSNQLSFAIDAATCESWNLTKEANPNVKLAVLASDAVYDLAPNPLPDRVVMLSHKDRIACLVNGEGSANGSVTCGFVDMD
ncbi:hypothetical protein V2H45_04460 [Tumidithrix elongata RA019]|uniref:Ig-like domain-containing protein n=1 Tax=Tumidithrix elongata BACA0141 TaxID=2716417 RepID=A0AAW9PTS3_9CYAN|nr:hypothetical protein [Tumidithrix elongata RA019]